MLLPALKQGFRSALRKEVQGGSRWVGSVSASKIATENAMMCFQCAQTTDGVGCTVTSVCSKTPETAALQDLLVDQLKRLAYYGANEELDEATLNAVGKLASQGLFSTMTNVNFDSERMREEIAATVEMTQQLAKGSSLPPLPRSEIGLTVGFEGGAAEVNNRSIEELQALGREVGVDTRRVMTESDDLWSVRELITYGLKGTSAYADHALELDTQKSEVWKSLLRSLDTISPYGRNTTSDLGALLGEALSVGATNFTVMEMLDHAHTSRFGHPEPTQVSWTPKEGKAIVLSGHDLLDVYEMLRATEGTGINVYTHGELMNAGAYPGLKKFPHLAGHYGTAWQNQRAEFPFFPGPIVLTTNCLMQPRKSYMDRLYTRSVVGYPGAKHLGSRKDFKKVVDHALRLPGFPAVPASVKPKFLQTGFGHNTILSLAEQVVGAVKEGKIKHFFLVGGCDGSTSERSYYRDIAMGAPKDTVILTLACGKYRFIGDWQEFGAIEHDGVQIPRLLDIGQCNDSYGAVKVAGALANAFECGVNDLPLSYAISWLEQKAVAVLLSLLHLGIENIRLGPNLPAFITPNVLGILVDKFKIAPANVKNPEEDLKYFLNK